MGRAQKLAIVMLDAVKSAPDKASGKLTDFDTLKTYNRGIDRFCDWAKTTYGIKRYNQLERVCKEKEMTVEQLVQIYADGMVDEGRLKAATIHTYLTPVCKGLGISMDKIDKPLRKSENIIKNTKRSTNERGRKEQQQERIQPLLELAQMAPLRPQALVRITTDSIETKYGVQYIRIRDKGGKDSIEILMPGEAARVRELLSHDLDGNVVAPGQRPFSKSDIGHIAWSQFRIGRSQELERYFERMFARDPAAKKPWVDWICNLYAESHPKLGRSKLEKYRRDLERPGRYALRGGNLKRAKELGRPTSYDRVALRIASVFALSHWVDETTVRNYLTK